LVINLTSTPTLELGLYSACVSSPLATGIHVAIILRLDCNRFNEPFAVSLFLRLKLGHAWLSLWDKHMTTGRINQVENHETCTKVQCQFHPDEGAIPISVPIEAQSTSKPSVAV
jgi:hypothetical protein